MYRINLQSLSGDPSPDPSPSGVDPDPILSRVDPENSSLDCPPQSTTNITNIQRKGVNNEFMSLYAQLFWDVFNVRSCHAALKQALLTLKLYFVFY